MISTLIMLKIEWFVFLEKSFSFFRQGFVKL